jgi:aminoglycoside phosphotransferase (APT) family kinase protein
VSGAVYSERLGAIADEQFAAAAARMGVGEFISATPISAGLFGQNVFISTTAGEFVLRGAPHWVRGPNEADFRRDDRFQFAKETFFADRLRERTRAPTPWPYLHDRSSDIFGWPYLIMPRMPGVCFNERSILKTLAPKARGEVAEAAGATLAQMQTLTWPFAGDFDVDTIQLTPDPGGAGAHTIVQARRFAGEAEAKGVMVAGDMDWIEAIFGDARTLKPRPVTFVHGDYKLDNMTVAQAVDGRWEVSGVFDLHTARFGDGAYDLVRASCAWLDTEPTLARVFIDGWRAAGGGGSDPAPWMPLHVVAERLIFWRFQADARPAWSRGLTFRGWAEPYLAKLLDLLA